MSTYPASQAEHFQRLLQHREQDLRQALAALQEDDEAASTQEVSDFKDVALRQADTEMDELQAHRIEAALQRVAAARHRLATGRFGDCTECGQPLDLRRLELLPEAELCTTCQAGHEGKPR